MLEYSILQKKGKLRMNEEKGFLGKVWKYINNNALVCGIVSGTISGIAILLFSFVFGKIPEKIDELETWKMETTNQTKSLCRYLGIDSQAAREDNVTGTIDDHIREAVNDALDDYADKVLIPAINAQLKETIEEIVDEKLDERLGSESEGSGTTYTLTTKFTEISKDYSPLEAAPPWSGDEEIAKEIGSDRKLKAKELENKKLLLYYKEGTKDVFFHGKFNSKNQWEGDCTINVYKGDSLEMIMEAVYEDGELKSYRQAFPGKTIHDDKVWYVSDREVESKWNDGETWTYFREGRCTKKFTKKNVTARDVIGIDKFKKKFCKRQEGYYCGRTSNGRYNDERGTAFYVKYTRKGVTRLLYQGKFQEGYANDASGDAWHVVLGDDGKYYYEKGQFENGKIIRTSVTENNNSRPLDEEQMDYYAEKIGVLDKVNWK